VKIDTPSVDWLALSPELSLLAAAAVCLLAAVLLPGWARRGTAAFVALAGFVTAGIFAGVVYDRSASATLEVGSAIARDRLGAFGAIIICGSGILAVFTAYSHRMSRSYVAEYYALLATAGAGMCFFLQAHNLMTLFLGLEWFSIALYVLCAIDMELETSLESGLKYLIIGSFGSATLLFGSALVYGATGKLEFSAIAANADPHDALFVAGLAMMLVGFGYKASAAPFHQWTPDVYQGAPTPITAFMAVATKAAAFGVFLRLFFDALGSAQTNWAPALAVLATITIIIGNVGALAQRSMKRLLAWSSVGQAGYLLAGVVVGNELGLQATMFYLAVYGLMNIAAFSVVIARERVDERGDDIDALENLGRASPWLAWPMTIAMLSLAGFPATAGFIGKFYLIDATVQGDYAWLGVMIVVGSIISLGYYLRVIAVMWLGAVEIDLAGPMRRRVARVGGWSPEADAIRQPEVLFVAVVTAAATIFFGIFPNPLFDAAREVGSSLSHLF